MRRAAAMPNKSFLANIEVTCTSFWLNSKDILVHDGDEFQPHSSTKY